MTLTFVRSLIARGLAQGAAKWPRPIKALASGEPLGPKLDEVGKHAFMVPSLLYPCVPLLIGYLLMIADVMGHIVASEEKVQAQLAAQGKLMTEVIDSFGRLGGQTRRQGKKMDRLRVGSEDKRVSQKILFQSFGKGFKLFSRMTLEQHLGSLGFSHTAVKIDRTIPEPSVPGEGHEVSLFAEAPFVLGDCTTMLSSVAQVTDFLEKVPLIKRAMGKEDEAPRLYFFALRVNEAIEQEAIAMLDKANCLWYIDGNYSPDLISWRLRRDSGSDS